MPPRRINPRLGLGLAFGLAFGLGLVFGLEGGNFPWGQLSLNRKKYRSFVDLLFFRDRVEMLKEVYYEQI